jgi:cell division protein FtsQ
MTSNNSLTFSAPKRQIRKAPRRKTRSLSNQPLKPFSVGWPFWTVMAVVGVLMTYATVRNFDAITLYLNRPINTVHIETTLQHVNEGEVKTLLAVYMGEGFFNLDVSEVRTQLESHPWVARAEVKRVWPHRLTIGLTEEVAIARWGEDKLLNQQANIFAPFKAGLMESLPLLSGPQGSQQVVMEQYQVLSQLFSPDGLRIEQLNLNDRLSWELRFADGVKVVIGKTDAREKIKRLMEIYDTQVRNDIAVIETIDLRYSNGFTVKKKQQDISGVAAR